MNELISVCHIKINHRILPISLVLCLEDRELPSGF